MGRRQREEFEKWVLTEYLDLSDRTVKKKLCKEELHDL